MRRLILSLVLLSTSALGQMEGNPANWCREGFFTRDSDTFRIAAVRGGRTAKAYFYGDDRDVCPGGPNCRLKSFVVGGDEVLVNRGSGDYSCVWFASRGGRSTIGWLRTSDLRFDDQLADPSIRAWLGEWKYGDNVIEFTENKLPGYLNVTGNATWTGANPGNIHVGELDGRYEPKNGVINYSDGDDEYDCKATLRLIGRYLVVADNLKCGGVNVSFSGVYTKKKG